ncbi:hypothetical protein N7449_009557 [Penicillium cf. viridicatum]|uniref:Uncharacterized protein n=1 Tax=Penicillium cf. viridicatum TaxID=2972119 RepID=A0A9W9JAM2_9EURO|nr:hypothetical protein N7449_009557 [Penicillium cf. viridicatum]
MTSRTDQPEWEEPDYGRYDIRGFGPARVERWRKNYLKEENERRGRIEEHWEWRQKVGTLPVGVSAPRPTLLGMFDLRYPQATCDLREAKHWYDEYEEK